MLRELLRMAHLIGVGTEDKKHNDEWKPAPTRVVVASYESTAPMIPQSVKRDPGSGKHNRSTWGNDRGRMWARRVQRRRVKNAMAKLSRRRNRGRV